MLGAVARRLFGSANDRLVKSMRKTVDAINALEPSLVGLSDEALRAKTDEFRRAAGAGRDAWTTCRSRRSRWCARPPSAR